MRRDDRRARSSLPAACLLPAACFLLAACGPAVGPACEIEGGPFPFPDGLSESSGVAWSVRSRDLVWSVPDGRADRIWALDLEGRVVAELPLRLPGVWDVEDLAAGPCDEGACLYLADVGDNAGTRDSVVVWTIVEPAFEPDAREVMRFDRVDPIAATTLRYTGEPENVEAVFIDRGGRIRLVSKGAERPARHFRGPPVTSTDSVAYPLEPVQTLGEETRVLANQITGASAISGSDRVVLRTYRDLILHRLEGEVLVPVEGGTESLLPLRESQGEAIAVDREGRVVVTSEAGPLGRAGGMHILHCPGLVR
ncbi:MAG: hypothetical protein RQ745_05645 [Longimicrobiales bacterium]|nr:hypothetical protein [Longimicrobiales bacterium]